MKPANFDLNKFVNPDQVGGIESYTINDGAARGVRALCVNTGAGLRYRVLVDRGLDIDQAFFDNLSLAFLTHKGPTAPSRGLDKGADWLKGFPGGLLTTCGPFAIGGPCTDAGEQLGLHGPHSNTGATLQSVIGPNPRAGQMDMTISGMVRYGALYGPCVELRRTMTSTLGKNVIRFVDELFNAGNTPVPHAWLLHANFGYPLVDEGAKLCVDFAKPPESLDEASSKAIFASDHDCRTIPGPIPQHDGATAAVGYFYPRPVDASGKTTVAILNPKLSLAVAIHYNVNQFPRCVNWQHLGAQEYVVALEPSNGSVEGRDKDRARGILDSIAPGATKRYEYAIEVVTEPKALDALTALIR